MATHRSGDVAARVDGAFRRGLRVAAPDPRALRRPAGKGDARIELRRRRPAQAMGAGWVEGWRGEIFVALEIGRRRPHRPLPLPRPVVAELAGARARGDRQHRSRLPADQQVLQPELLGTRPLDVAPTQADCAHRHRHRAGAGRELTATPKPAHRSASSTNCSTSSARRWRSARSTPARATAANWRSTRSTTPTTTSRAGHQVRRQPAPCRPAARHRAGVAPHGRSAAPHLRRHARARGLVVAVGDCGCTFRTAVAGNYQSQKNRAAQVPRS